MGKTKTRTTMNIRNLALAKGKIVLMYKIKDSDKYYSSPKANEDFELDELINEEDLKELQTIANVVVVQGATDDISYTLEELRKRNEN